MAEVDDQVEELFDDKDENKILYILPIVKSELQTC